MRSSGPLLPNPLRSGACVRHPSALPVTADASPKTHEAANVFSVDRPVSSRATVQAIRLR